MIVKKSNTVQGSGQPAPLQPVPHRLYKKGVTTRG